MEKLTNFRKRVVSLGILLAVVLSMSSFETPLKEGRRWQVERYEYVPYFVNKSDTIYYTVLNDTVIDGINCKNILFEEKYHNPVLYQAYDDNGCIMMYNYPFEGKFAQVWDMNMVHLEPFTMNIFGIEREIHPFYHAPMDYWIEGIGSVYGWYLSYAMRPFGGSHYRHIIKVWDGDELIFDKEKFDAHLSAIENVMNDSDEEPEVLFNLQGIRVDYPQEGTIYVTSRGRKILWK